MNALMLLADGFEDTEALTTRDILIRGGVKVITASIKEDKLVNSSFGLNLYADSTINDVDLNSFDCLILPGGGRGTQNLKNSQEVASIVANFVLRKKLICAICAAPSALGDLGCLDGKNYTCYAGFNYNPNATYTASDVEVDGNYITGRSMKYSIKFGLTILEKLMGKEAREKVEIGIEGLSKKWLAKKSLINWEI